MSLAGVFADGALWTVSQHGFSWADAALLKIDPVTNATLGITSLAGDPDGGYFEDVTEVDGILYVLGRGTLTAIRSSDGVALSRVDFADLVGLWVADTADLLMWDETTGRLYVQVADASNGWERGLLAIAPADLCVPGQ